MKLCTVAHFSCLPMHSIAQRIFEHVLPCRRTTPQFAREVFPISVIFLLLQQKYLIQKHLLKSFNYCFIQFAFTLSTSQKKHGQEMMWVRQHPHVSSSSSTWEPFSASFQPILMSSTKTDRKNPCFRRANIPNFGAFSHPSSSKASSNCLLPSFVTQTSSVQQRLHKQAPESSFTMSPRSTTRPLHF